MKARSCLTGLGCFLAAAAALAGLLCASGWLMRPEMGAPPPAYPAEEVQAAEAARRIRIDPDNPPVLYRRADYAQGPAAAWFPKGESPMLAELVRQGKLPPVAERVGPEPAVVEGVEGIGRYGGTWIRAANTDSDVFGVMASRMSGPTLIRWSPQGPPLVPHVAREFRASDDYRQFTFILRRGMKWSDGEPFTALDVQYWWDHEATDELLSAAVPQIMKVAGKSGRIRMLEVLAGGATRPLEWKIAGRPGRLELSSPDGDVADPAGADARDAGRARAGGGVSASGATGATGEKRTIDAMLIDAIDPATGRTETRRVDPYRLLIEFPEPNGLFLMELATAAGGPLVDCPAHYLWKYHPHIGDRQAIAEMMTSRRLASPLAVYRTVKGQDNPEHPRLRPWVYRTHRANPPYGLVRNPYYWLVDTQGNQLPYVDQLHFEVRSGDMIGVAASGGQITMQARHLAYDQYTLLMSQRRPGGYEVLHWYFADRSNFVISPNLNRRIDPDRPDTRLRHELLNDRRFRQALSLAINRRDIILAEYNGQTEPAQCAPGPESPFYEPALYHSCTRYDPKRAGELLDEIGLTNRDYEGYRTFRDGSRMLFYLNLSQSGLTAVGPAQFIIDDWKAVGVRVILRVRSRTLFYTEKAALDHDLNIWTGNGEHFPLLEPRYLVPVSGESNQAPAFARWYMRGGLYGDPLSRGPGCAEPPVGHPIRQALEAYEKVSTTGDLAAQREIFRQVLRLAAENVWTINVCTPPPAIAVVKDGFRNVPRNAVYGWDFLSPANLGIETFFFEQNADSRGAIEQMQQAVLKVTPPPDAPAAAGAQTAGGPVRRIVPYALLAGGLALLGFLGVRYPYIGRRLLIMVPTLLLISMIVFTIIQLPPGDYLTSRIMQLQESGDTADLKQIEELRDLFHLEDPMPVRYARWLGLAWFLSFDARDEGLLQGNLGRSMESGGPVNQIVGDRILLTVLISLGSILFTWAAAIPTGIYSAVRQYSLADYVLTLLGFIGMCVPSFLLALILMYLGRRHLGVEVSGLFSARYGAQPNWDWGKVVDLLKHIWLPVAVLGVGGTAGMIRVMRGNLLDELKKPYVVTARAKGVRPTRLLLKYPVRLALNPFISGIGGLFPQLVSGGAIVAMVLSLPTVGPLMLQALMTEDMYLAGSMLMVLSLLGILGTLVSDLLLLWLDPRIRFQGGGR